MPEPPDLLPRRARVTPAEAPSTHELSVLATGVVVVAGLYLARQVLIPITLAVLLSFVLSPLVNKLRRLWLGRVSSILLAVLLAIGVAVGTGTVIGSQVADLVTDLPRYESTIRHKTDAIRSVVAEPTSKLLGSFKHELQLTGAPQSPGLPPAAPALATGAGEQRPIPVEIRPADLSPFEIAERVLGPIIDPVATVFIIFVVTIFILLQKEDVRDRMIRLFGSRDLHRTTVAMDDAARRLSKYFVRQLGVNAGFGLTVIVGLLVIGVPSPVLWGILAGLLRFIPYVGAFIGALLPITLAAAVDPGWSMMLWTAGLFLVTEGIVGQAVEPLIYGHSTGLSPVAVVVSAIFWTWLWGPIGLILSTPMTVCLVVLGRHIDHLEFLDVLLGDRPALTPVESFYQRMLAGDPDEVLEYAELLLKDRSLSSYYDEVALKGLQLAAADSMRGVLTPVQTERIREAIQDLVQDLSDHDDVEAPPDQRGDAAAAGQSKAEREPPKEPAVRINAPPVERRSPLWRSETPILCIAGRGELDSGAAAMLTQLLAKHGFNCRFLQHQAVSRSAIASLDLEGVAMVCISYLEINGTPSHLRYLLRRIRHRLPAAKLLVGLWPSDDPILWDAELRKVVGADFYVTTLRDAVAACVAAAWEEALPEESRVAIEPGPKVIEPVSAGPTEVLVPA